MNILLESLLVTPLSRKPHFKMAIAKCCWGSVNHVAPKLFQAYIMNTRFQLWHKYCFNFCHCSNIIRPQFHCCSSQYFFMASLTHLEPICASILLVTNFMLCLTGSSNPYNQQCLRLLYPVASSSEITSTSTFPSSELLFSIFSITSMIF